MQVRILEAKENSVGHSVQNRAQQMGGWLNSYTRPKKQLLREVHHTPKFTINLFLALFTDVFTIASMKQVKAKCK